MKDRNNLIGMYNATSTHDGKGGIETYESWLERQLLSRIEKLESLQPKSKTKEEVREIFDTIVDHDYNGYTKESILKAIEYAQSHANKDGWVSVEDLQKALKMQVEECAIFAQRCARDKGMASAEYDEWIKSTPILDLPPKPQI